MVGADDRAVKAQAIFRWGTSAVTVVVVARILQDWFHERDFWRAQAAKSLLPTFTSFVIIHTNSSFRTHACLAAVVVLGALQIFLCGDGVGWRVDGGCHPSLN